MLMVDRYRPQKLAEVIGNRENIVHIVTYLRNFKQDGLHPLLVCGPPGTGKTTSVELAGKHCKLDIISLDASSEQKASDMKRLQESLSSSGLVQKQRMLLIDEADGLDQGGAGPLLKLIKNYQATIPMILIANNLYARSIKGIKNHCTIINWTRPAANVIVPRLLQMGVINKKGEAEKLAMSCRGDVRQILHTLQMGALQSTILPRPNLFEIAKSFFTTPPKSKRGWMEERLYFYELERDLLPWMIQENYANPNNMKKMEDVAEAADWISDGDVWQTQHRDTPPDDLAILHTIAPSFIMSSSSLTTLRFPKHLFFTVKNKSLKERQQADQRTVKKTRKRAASTASKKSARKPRKRARKEKNS